ncbi:S1 RNA binding domain [Desulfocucumis palustris]|uniref:S1 RNA binding domain n=1 Tax=Desulfocucumis palustris TaxID=1898651 RepID=A0A2L2X7L8_9FIRM|nr:S1-like domain-containing RNA-binding protein [Desulfocucumis palustris]GBF32078.1 S1 RNA binding domain [Desulfocucumis palustris]
MMEIGKMQILQLNRMTKTGAYLNCKNANGKDDVLLPQNEVPRGYEIGDQIEVFVYKNSEGKTMATVTKPKLTIGELGLLRVVGTTNFGAFLDWDLQKDLLLPLREQVGKIEKGDLCLVGLCVNNSGKIYATMYIYDMLSTQSPYKQNDMVSGTVYGINKDIGIFVAVDNKYHGFIHNKELYNNFTVGDNVEARVKRVREDGKLELSLRKQAYNEIEGDALKIMDRLRLGGGILSVNDNSSPEHIKAELNMSKSAFKRAVGRLLKEGAIKITEEGIEMLW